MNDHRDEFLLMSPENKYLTLLNLWLSFIVRLFCSLQLTYTLNISFPISKQLELKEDYEKFLVMNVMNVYERNSKQQTKNLISFVAYFINDLFWVVYDDISSAFNISISTGCWLQSKWCFNHCLSRIPPA